ncbi:FkbM family methyltransferase [Methylophilaceae bacterium Uisw_099_01]
MKKSIIQKIRSKISSYRKIKEPLTTTENNIKSSFKYFSELSNKKNIANINFSDKKSIIELYDKRKFFFNPLDGTASKLFSIPITGEFEQKETDMVGLLLKKGDTCIDVGANFGYYSIYMSQKVGSNGYVHAFEPLNHTWNILQANCILNDIDNIKNNELALDEVLGEKEIYLPDIGISGSFKLHKYDKAFKKFVIKTTSLDNYVIENKVETINFIKADIEGAEFLMIKGAIKSIEKFKPILFLEIQEHSTVLFGYKPIDIMSYLFRMGYQVFYVVDKKLVKCDDFIELPDYNFFFIHESKLKNYANLIFQ